jgi:hypothetical protein
MNALFISYGHRDMEPVNWVERLKLYLAPLRRQELVDVWDDSMIRAGSEWRREIGAALDRATATILVVGPGFLASDFIAQQELPSLLEAAEGRGAKIYPLVVGYCAYKLSVLEKYQAFNDPDKPLEALTPAEQNKILNGLSLAVDEDLRHGQAPTMPPPLLVTDTRQAMNEIAKYLQNTGAAFVAQSRRRNQLVAMIEDRLKVKENLEYENFFFRYYGKLNDEEKFQFEQIRAMTEGPLHDGNQKILSIIEGHPQVLEEIPRLVALRQHLVFWLNKYDKVFAKRPEMCLLYTGVEDQVPFPKGLDLEVAQWIREHRQL